MLFSLSLIVGFLIVSAFLSGAETSIISVSQAKIHKLKTDGDKRAITLTKLRENKEGFIGAILLCNTLTNSAASAITTDLCTDIFGDNGLTLLIATMIIATSILIFAEMLPKTYAVRHSDSMALRIAYICSIITFIFSPIVRTFSYVINKTLNLLQGGKGNGINISALDTIKSTIDIHHQEGEVMSEYKYMLGGVIDLETMDVEEIMVHRNELFSINLDQPIKSILKLIGESPYSRIPLWRENPDNIIGVLHIKDMNKILLDKHNNGKISIQDIEKHARAPWFIPNTTNLKAQLLAFKEQHYHFALVVDEYGDLEGMVTLEDVIEEVVGQIEDEYDVLHRGVFKTNSDGSVLVSGNTSIRDVNRELEWDINHKEATTVGGLLFHIAQRVPELGEKFTTNGYTFKLIKKKRNKILKVKVSKNPETKQ